MEDGNVELDIDPAEDDNMDIRYKMEMRIWMRNSCKVLAVLS